MKHSSNQTRQAMSLYWHYTKQYPRAFWTGAIGAVVATIIQGIIPPLVIAQTFRQLQSAYARHESLQFSDFTLNIIIFGAAMFFGMVIWRLQSFSVWQFEIGAQRDMSNDMYRHIQSQSQRFHADRFAGGLVSQVNKFLSGYETLMDVIIWNIIPGLTIFIASLGVLVFAAPKYALVMLLVTASYVTIMSRRVKKQLPYNIATARKESEQTGALADAIGNMSTIRSFANEVHENSRFGSVVNQTYLAQRKLSVEILKTEAISHSMTNTFQLIAFLFGLVAVTSFSTNVGILYLIISYTGAIVEQLRQFGRIIRNVNRSMSDAVEMAGILNITPEVKDPERPEKVAMRRGEVVFDNVTFFYPENSEDPLFERLSLKIKPGEKIGLVGHSGGGKTTVTKLLLRFMDIKDGAIRIDGQDIARVTQQDLRSRITYVSQEPILFHRSILENIQYGNLEATYEEVVAAAKMANAHEFIDRLPHGYDTLVGERGVKLSGGQRQRVAIARAMLKNAPLLVLDEATSALDSESEVLIQDALWRLMEGKTAIVIAHRLSTIQKMDRILVLDSGKIVEEGSHKELIHADGTYAKLWRHQSGGFIED